MTLLQCLRFNQMTAYPWSLEKTVRNCSASAFRTLACGAIKLDRDAEKTDDSQREGLRASSLCRRGWFSSSVAAQPPSCDIFC
jgi:hypothetical protein